MTTTRNCEDKSLFKTVVRNSTWSAFAVVASPVLQFVFGGLTLRYVGVEATGFSLTVGAVLGIAGRFGTCGIAEASLPALASSLTSRNVNKTRRLIGVVLAIHAVSSVVTAAALYICVDPLITWSRVPIPRAIAHFYVACASITFVLGQLNLALTTFLRAAGRYDLVTGVTTPLTLVSGIVACVMVPLFPSLTTVAIVGLASTTAALLITLAVVSLTVPAVRRPSFGVVELPGLARYGFWLLLTHALSALTGGIDEIVISGMCGAAALPPWAIGKRLWLTAHTFLAQHTEHLIPTLGSLRHTAGHVAAGVAMAMHWYVMLLAAMGYTFMASSGESIVGLFATADVAVLCRPSIFSYSLTGIVFALLIIPVITAMAESASRPAFIVALLSNTSQIAAVFWLASMYGAPAVYYAPVAALPLLLLATGTTATSIFDAHAAWRWIRPVLVPNLMGLAGIVASMAIVNGGFTAWQRLAAGGVLCAGVLAATIVTEQLLSINAVFHRQLIRVLSHALDLTAGSVYRICAAYRGRARGKPEKVSS
jgi:O-antigen/teichoic acid export membrane protein